MIKGKGIPLAITFLTGIIIIITFFIPHSPFGEFEQTALRWYSIIAGFTMLLGVDSLLRVHIKKVRKKDRNWQYSIVVFAAFAVIVTAGLVSTIRTGNAFNTGTSFMYIYNHMIIPLQSTMFSLLAFFIASAAYRAFRARNIDATLLLITAIIVMLGRVPITERFLPQVPVLTEWIMSVPQMAAKRGIIIGIALGAVGVSLRIILGIERSYLS